MGNTVKADGETFLTKDPNWATDFAPDGSLRLADDVHQRDSYADLHCPGDLVKEGSWMTRKRYAE